MCAAEGASVGLRLEFYGRQGALPLNYFPETVLKPSLRLYFQSTSANSEFMMMVQTKDSPALEESKEQRVQVKRTNGRYGERLPVTFLELADRGADYQVGLQGQITIQISAEEQKSLDAGIMQIRRIQSVFAEASKTGKTEVIEEMVFKPKELKDQAAKHQLQLDILLKIKNKKLIKESEKKLILGMNYFARIGFIVNYPTEDKEILIQLKKLTRLD